MGSCRYCGHAYEEHTGAGCQLLLVSLDNQQCPCEMPFGGEAATIIDKLPIARRFVREDPFTLEEEAELYGTFALPDELREHEALQKRAERHGPAY